MSTITRKYARALDNFVALDNRWARDRRLSYRALGLLTELTSHKVGWRVSMRTLAAHRAEGRDAIAHAVRDLETAGYLQREQVVTAGRFAGMNYVLCDPWDDPPSAPMTENQSTGLTCGNAEPPWTDSQQPESREPVESPHKKNRKKKNISLPTEEKEDQKNTRRGNLASGDTRKRSDYQSRVAGDATSSEGAESPACGANPTARQESLRKAAAAGTTGGGLAERLKRGLEPQGMHVTASAVARTLNADFALPHGPSRELQREMVDLFIRNHAQYTPNDKIAPWQRFLAQRDSIAVDAKAILAARARDTRYSDYDPEDDAAYFAESDARRELQKKEAEQS